jgi:hypothetical protein
VNYTLLDGTEVQYRVLTPADVAAAVYGTTDDTQMFVEVIRLAVAKPENVLERIAGLPDPIGQTALLGTEIILASLRARVRLVTEAVEQATARALCDHHDPPAGVEQGASPIPGDPEPGALDIDPISREVSPVVPGYAPFRWGHGWAVRHDAQSAARLLPFLSASDCESDSSIQARVRLAFSQCAAKLLPRVECLTPRAVGPTLAHR